MKANTLSSVMAGRKVVLDFHAWVKPEADSSSALNLPIQARHCYQFKDEVCEIATVFADSDGTPKYQVILPNGHMVELYAHAFSVRMV